MPHYTAFGKIKGSRCSGAGGALELVVETSDERTVIYDIPYDIPTGGRRQILHKPAAGL